MHELGLCSSIVDVIERRAGERTVARVPLACPTCGAVEIELLGGDEFVLELIEYREQGAR